MVLGRTNRVFPSVWHRPLTSPNWEAVIDRLAAEESPIDISSSPGLWGHRLRDSKAPILIRVGRELHRTVDANHATDIIQAELIENLSCLGRPFVEIVALSVTKPLEEFQIDGALRALTLAREEGHIGFLGLASEGNPLATRGVWQFHDAFELLLVRDQATFDQLSPLAHQRRVGVVATGVPGAQTDLVEVVD